MEATSSGCSDSCGRRNMKWRACGVWRYELRSWCVWIELAAWVHSGSYELGKYNNISEEEYRGTSRGIKKHIGGVRSCVKVYGNLHGVERINRRAASTSLRQVLYCASRKEIDVMWALGGSYIRHVWGSCALTFLDGGSYLDMLVNMV